MVISFEAYISFSIAVSGVSSMFPGGCDLFAHYGEDPAFPHEGLGLGSSQDGQVTQTPVSMCPTLYERFPSGKLRYGVVYHYVLFCKFFDANHTLPFCLLPRFSWIYAGLDVCTDVCVEDRLHLTGKACPRKSRGEPAL